MHQRFHGLASMANACRAFSTKHCGFKTRKRGTCCTSLRLFEVAHIFIPKEFQPLAGGRA